MTHSQISAKGGRARSEAKSIANREKIRAYWMAVRIGEATPPRRRRFSGATLDLARRYIWWEPPQKSLRRPLRVVAQVLDLGTISDCSLVERESGRKAMRESLENAEPGWFGDRSWTYWHYRLGLTPWGAEPPPLPIRTFS
jgi:hypothetical protein